MNRGRKEKPNDINTITTMTEKKPMDASTAFQMANACVVDEDFPSAISYYDEAIRLISSSSGDDDDIKALYLEKRSQCHIKLEKFDAALKDADAALELDARSVNAHLRRGAALFEMEKYADAKQAFESCLQIEPGNARCKTWIRKCESELKESGQLQTATTSAESDVGVPASSERITAPPSTESSTTTKQGSPKQSEIKPPTAKDRIKYNFYQMNNQVVLSVIGLRNVAQDARRVNIDTEKVHVSIDLPDGDKWEKTFDLLYPIDPSKSTFKNTSVKTEITLIKEDASVEWKALEKSEAALKEQDSRDPKRFYPSSKGNKDWDGVEKEVVSSLGEEKPEGDAALNQLFQSIYSGANEEARRAMIKSFTESGGTVLSTNWDEVSQKRVDPTPPDGMEKRTWTGK